MEEFLGLGLVIDVIVTACYCGSNKLFLCVCPAFTVLLHLHEIVEGLYFHCSLSVCLSVCVCVCVCVCVSGSFLVNKIPAERMHRFGRGFR